MLIICLDRRLAPDTSELVVYLNKACSADGCSGDSFERKVILKTNSGPIPKGYIWYTSPGDVDGDGYVDFVTSTRGGVHWTRNRGGKGDFTPEDTFFIHSGDHGIHVAAADLDGDGNLDVVTGGNPGGKLIVMTAFERKCRSPSTTLVERNSGNFFCERCPGGHYLPVGFPSFGECYNSRCLSGQTDHDNDTATPCQQCDRTGHGMVDANTGVGDTLHGACEDYLCKVGYTDDDFDSTNACSKCPANSFTVGSGSIGFASCFCDADHYDTVKGPEVDCARCPTNATSVALSTSPCHCSCESGTFNANANCTALDAADLKAAPDAELLPVCQACRVCGVGYFQTGTCGGEVDYSCTACPDPHATTDSTGATSVTECRCKDGYYNENSKVANDRGDGISCAAVERIPPTARLEFNRQNGAGGIVFTNQPLAYLTIGFNGSSLLQHPDVGGFRSIKPLRGCNVTAEAGASVGAVCPKDGTNAFAATGEVAEEFFGIVLSEKGYTAFAAVRIVQEGAYRMSTPSGAIQDVHNTLSQEPNRVAVLYDSTRPVVKLAATGAALGADGQTATVGLNVTDTGYFGGRRLKRHELAINMLAAIAKAAPNLAAAADIELKSAQPNRVLVYPAGHPNAGSRSLSAIVAHFEPLWKAAIQRGTIPIRAATKVARVDGMRVAAIN